MIKLLTDSYFHIYNRGNNNRVLFREDGDYLRFLKYYKKYAPRALNTFAFCLMNNHFHFLVYIPLTKYGKRIMPKFVSKQLSNVFNAYAQKYNIIYNGSGSLFEKHFKRKLIDSTEYLTRLIVYIHKNPWHHNIQPDFTNYPYSSYQICTSHKPTRLERSRVLTLFGGLEAFIRAHEESEIHLPSKYKFY